VDSVTLKQCQDAQHSHHEFRIGREQWCVAYKAEIIKQLGREGREIMSF
jgi:hypothetical protein